MSFPEDTSLRRFPFEAEQKKFQSLELPEAVGHHGFFRISSIGAWKPSTAQYEVQADQGMPCDFVFDQMLPWMGYLFANDT